jgi:OmpR family response regulator RpaB
MPHRVLIIEDDPRLAAMVAEYLGNAGFRMTVAPSGEEGLAALAGGAFDALVLDLMLPDMDGLEVCRRVRAGIEAHKGQVPQSGIPILMLTARGDATDRVVGLELGADDYLPKPFEPRELLARLQTVWRRSAAAAAAAAAAPAAPAPLHFERLSIDPARHTVQLDGRAVELTGTEFELLLMLAAVPGRVFGRDDILNRLRGHAAEDIHSRAVDLLVSRLRRKLEPLDVIHTRRNAGYLFAGVRT